jgi:hypothetical protein
VIIHLGHLTRSRDSSPVTPFRRSQLLATAGDAAGHMIDIDCGHNDRRNHHGDMKIQPQIVANTSKLAKLTLSEQEANLALNRTRFKPHAVHFLFVLHIVRGKNTGITPQTIFSRRSHILDGFDGRSVDHLSLSLSFSLSCPRAHEQVLISKEQ